MMNASRERVCDRDVGLEMSATQSAQYGDLVNYVGEEDGRSTDAVGPVMCTLALIVWLLTISKEFNGLWDLARAVWALPRAPATALADGADGAVRFDGVSSARAAGFLAVLAVRAGVCGVLTYYGCLFLVYTVGVGDLLLNAVSSTKTKGSKASSSSTIDGRICVDDGAAAF